MKISLGTRASLRYRQGYVRNGVRHLVTPWRDHLILDCGLDKVAALSWADCFQFALWGNQVAPDPVRRDSNPITFTVVGNVCTASGNFFVAQDSGRLIKFNDLAGQEFYLTFVSGTVCNLSAVPAPGIAAQTATIWYVNETALQSLVSTGNTYGSAGGDNGTTFAGADTTMKRTIIGGALGAPTTLTEVGFSNSAANVNIFDRDIIAGGVPMLAGDQPLVIVELTLTLSPSVPTAVGNVGTGFDSSGNAQVVAFSLNRVSATGGNAGFGTAGAPHLEPSQACNIAIFNAAPAVPAYSPNGSYQPSVTNPTSTASAVYTPGTFSRDFSCHYDVATGNGNIYGFETDGYDGIAVRTGFTQVLTTPFVKTAAQILDVIITKNWQRILVN